MAIRFNLAYYYVSPEDLARIEAFRECSGDSEKYLVTQYVRGFIGRNRQYYESIARYDAQTRGLTFRQWGEIVTAKGIEELPEHKEELKQSFDNPLKDIDLAPTVKRRTLNYITLGLQNTAYLRVGIYYDRDSAVNYVSKIVKEHLSRNWDALYKSQVEAENFENWK
jgi:hypothetical protein